MDPDNYHIIFNCMNGFGVTSDDIVSCSASSSTLSLQNSHYCNNEYTEALAQVANSFLRYLLSQLVEKTIVTAAAVR